MNKKVGLYLTNVCSFLSVLTYDGRSQDIASIDTVKLTIAGLLFTLYLLWLHWSQTSLGKAILYFGMLLSYYWLALVVGIMSWGLAIPVVGAIGAVLVKGLFTPEAKVLDSISKEYFITGLQAGLGGLAFFYSVGQVFVGSPLLEGKIGFGLSFGITIVTWQYIIGKKCIKKLVTSATTDHQPAQRIA